MNIDQNLIERYNKLGSLKTAKQTFLAQLTQAYAPERPTPLDPDQDAPKVRDAVRELLTELSPFFPISEETGVPMFAVWVLHGHHELKDGEKMVTKALHGASKPQRSEFPYELMKPEQSPKSVTPIRWDNEGLVLEHAFVPEGSPPPLTVDESVWHDMLDHFKQVTKAKGINTLGICRGPSSFDITLLKEGYIFMETTATSDESFAEERKHGIDAVVLETNSQDLIETAWLPHPPIWNSTLRSLSPLSYAQLRALSDNHPIRMYGCTHVCTPKNHH